MLCWKMLRHHTDDVTKNFAMDKKKLGGGGLLVVQATPKEKCSQIWVAVEKN